MTARDYWTCFPLMKINWWHREDILDTRCILLLTLLCGGLVISWIFKFEKIQISEPAEDSHDNVIRPFYSQPLRNQKRRAAAANTVSHWWWEAWAQPRCAKPHEKADGPARQRRGMPRGWQCRPSRWVAFDIGCCLPFFQVTGVYTWNRDQEEPLWLFKLGWFTWGLL